MWPTILIFWSAITTTVITSENIPVAVCVIDGCKLRTPRVSGGSSFLGLLSSGNIFVDKTLLIKHLIDREDRINAIAAPAKFGKSINLSMLKAFFEITVDKEGNPVTRGKSNNYKFFAYGKIVVDYVLLTLKNPLLISEHKDVINRYQGKYPVVYLDLCSVTQKSFKGFFLQFKKCVAKTFGEHEYLLKMLRRKAEQVGKNGDSKDLRKFSRILAASEKVTVTDMMTSLRFLCGLLEEYFNSSSMVLIDEYDLPFNTMLMNEPFSRDDGKLDLLTDFFENSLTKNEGIEKAFLSGSLKLAKGVLFSETCNISNIHAFSDRNLSSFYGFSKTEVEGLFNAIRIPFKSLDYIYKFFKGYVIQGRQIYNPYSINGFIMQQIRGDYWIASVYVDSFVKKALWYISFQNLLLNLAYGMSMKIDLQNWEISEQDTRNFVAALSRRKLNSMITAEENESAMRLLCSGGYLTEVFSGQNFSVVACPNEEVSMVLMKKLYGYFKKIPLHQLSRAKAARVRAINYRLQKDQYVFRNLEDTFFFTNYSLHIRTMFEDFIKMYSRVIDNVFPLLR